MEPNARPSPYVLLVPPWGPRTPRGWRIAFAVILTLGISLVAVGLALVKREGYIWFVIGMCLFPVAFAILLGILYERKHFRRRREFVELYPFVLQNDTSEFERICHTPGRFPNARRCLPVVRARMPQAASQPVILCVGTVIGAVPSDDRFEPIIYSPAAQFGTGAVEIGTGLLIVGAWLLSWSGWLPWLPWRLPSACLFGAVVPVIGLAGWIWRFVVRPRYVRLAPGMIQFVQYGAKATPAEVRSYPMTAGTLVVINCRLNDCVLSVCRDDQHDEWRISNMIDSQTVLHSAWRAMMSTAETPPLSPSELVG